jgi:hypothetical protein
VTSSFLKAYLSGNSRKKKKKRKRKDKKGKKRGKKSPAFPLPAISSLRDLSSLLGCHAFQLG